MSKCGLEKNDRNCTFRISELRRHSSCSLKVKLHLILLVKVTFSLSRPVRVEAFQRVLLFAAGHWWENVSSKCGNKCWSAVEFPKAKIEGLKGAIHHLKVKGWEYQNKKIKKSKKLFTRLASFLMTPIEVAGQSGKFRKVLETQSLIYFRSASFFDSVCSSHILGSSHWRFEQQRELKVA